MAKTTPSAEQPGTERWKILALLTVTLLTRGRVTEHLKSSIAADEYGYLNMAGNLVDYGTLSWSIDPHLAVAARAPLYIWLLAPGAATYSFGPLATGVLHVLLALLTVWAVWHLALRWELPPWAALLAAGLVSLDPILVYETAQVWPTTLAACLTVLTLHALTSLWRTATTIHAILAGVCLALCGLCDTSYLLWIAVVGIFLARQLVQQSSLKAHRWRTAAIFLTATIGLLALWPVRNWITIGYGTPLTSRSGYYFLRGNNPDFYEFLHSGQWGDEWDSDPFNQAWKAQIKAEGFTVARRDRQAFGMAFANIAAAPHSFVYGVLVKLGWLWGLAPRDIELAGAVSPVAAKVVCGIWYAVEFLLALVGLRWLGRRALAAPWAFGVLLVGCYTLSMIFSWCEMLDRGPIMPVVALLAAAGTAHLVGRRGTIETIESEDVAPLGSAANLP